MATSSSEALNMAQQSSPQAIHSDQHTKHDAPLNSKECLPCRITGTGIMASTGAYAIWQSRAVTPGSPGQKKVVAGLGLALIVGSVFRWRSWK